MITIEKAFEIILGLVRPGKIERRSLGEALGCCLGGDIRADRDLPPTDRSAMDGYAVRAGDLARDPRSLRLVGEVSAGSAKRPTVRAGTCVTILTGASIPPGADTVVKVEETQQQDGLVTFCSPAKKGANIRLRGEEVSKGQIVLPKGAVLNAAQIGLCASVGKAAVRVYQRPDVAVLCTGEELRDAGEKVGPHQLRDSNGPALVAGLNAAGIRKIAHEIVPDDLKVLAKRLTRAAATCNVVILTGGVSVGKYDYVLEAVKQIGGKVRFHGVAMKPGRPQLYATLSGNRHIFGLPGNPLSVLTGFYELVLPAIRRMSGFDESSCREVLYLPLVRSVASKGTRANFFLGKLVWSKSGLGVKPIRSCGSADLAAGAKADGVIFVQRNVRQISTGELVRFTPWRNVL